MTIRCLGPGDAEAYRAFRLASIQQCPEAFGATYEEECQLGLDLIRARLEPGEGSFVLGAFDAALVGTVGLLRQTRQKRRHEGQVFGFFVEPAYRGQGIGDRLVSELIARSSSTRNLRVLKLGVITSCQAARRLYERHGFVSYGVEPMAHMHDGAMLDMDHLMLPL